MSYMIKGSQIREARTLVEHRRQFYEMAEGFSSQFIAHNEAVFEQREQHICRSILRTAGKMWWGSGYKLDIENGVLRINDVSDRPVLVYDL